MPSAPDWEKNPTRPRAREVRGEGGVEPHVGVGVGHPERVRADHPHAVGPGLGDQAPLGDDAAAARVGEPGAHHDAAR